MTLPLDKMNPPNTRVTSKTNVESTFATIMFLVAPPINRKSEATIWFIPIISIYCLINLSQSKTVRIGAYLMF